MFHNYLGMKIQLCTVFRWHTFGTLAFHNLISCRNQKFRSLTLFPVCVVQWSDKRCVFSSKVCYKVEIMYCAFECAQMWLSMMKRKNCNTFVKQKGTAKWWWNYALIATCKNQFNWIFFVGVTVWYYKSCMTIKLIYFQ